MAKMEHVLLSHASSKADTADAAQAITAAGTSEAPADFMKFCLSLTYAEVHKNQGSKDKVAASVRIACAQFPSPRDHNLCLEYRDSLLGHLHDTDYNMNKLDYPLFCSGFFKVMGEVIASYGAPPKDKKSAGAPAPAAAA